MYPKSCVAGLSGCRQLTETVLEDHRAHSKAEGADPRADNSFTTAGGESSRVRSETAAQHRMDAPACTGRAESICPMQTHEVQTGSFSEIQRLEILEISDSQCQQELLFYFTGGHKAAQQEEESEWTLAVMRKNCMSCTDPQ